MVNKDIQSEFYMHVGSMFLLKSLEKLSFSCDKDKYMIAEYKETYTNMILKKYGIKIYDEIESLMNEA